MKKRKPRPVREIIPYVVCPLGHITLNGDVVKPSDKLPITFDPVQLKLSL